MISVIIAAAGTGSRMGGSVKKQYRLIENLTVLEKTVKAFCAFKENFEIIVASAPEDVEYTKELLKAYENVSVTAGGKLRGESVCNALKLVKGDFVLVHDGARCFVDEGTIERVIEALKTNDAVIPCVSPKSTIRTKDKTLKRDELYEVQTPQGFKTELLINAYKKAFEDGITSTDDAGVVEHYGKAVAIVEGNYENIKITTKEDMPKIQRTGIGYDVHRLVESRPLMLGCTKIEYEKGLLGHSDADVLSHAIADAMLGAAGLRDIGYYFPDTSADTEGMPGRVILEKTMELVKNAGYSVVNIDSTIVAQKPKLLPYIEEMRCNMADALGIDVGLVAVKAKTEEGLGITGSCEAMSAYAVATLKG